MSINLNSFNNQLKDLSKILNNNLSILEVKEKELDSKISFKSSFPKIVTFQISNQKYQTLTKNILKFKSSLFYYILLKTDEEDALYFERNPDNFEKLLNFMKYNKVDLSDLSRPEINALINEANYYSLDEFVQYAENEFKNPFIIDFKTSNGQYIYKGNVIGSDKVEDITDISSSQGIALNYNSSVTFELDKPMKIKGVKVIGFKGNTSAYASSNGSNSKVSVSLDNKIFIEIGALGLLSNDLTTFMMTTIGNGKYVKLSSLGYLGLSYIEFIN